METSTPYEATGRTRQKARTRAAMITAARELLTEGITPTVEVAAERAAISRTTAYRYFTNQRSLLIAVYPELKESSLLGEGAPSDPLTRLDLVAESVTRQLLAHEPELRTMLRLSLEPGVEGRDLPLRQGRALGWVLDALSPLESSMPERDLRDLALMIRAAMGIEAFVWLTDVGGVSRDDAIELMRRSARELLQAAVARLGDAG